jgi:hypothetical protein
MGQLIPDGFLTIRDAAEKVAAAMYAGVPDRSSVMQFREQGFDVADGAAIDDATKTIASKLAAKIGEPAVAAKDGSKITRADFKRGRT